MTAVFVHGVPEVAAIWDPLIAAVGRADSVALALPGFGSPLPAGFEPTKERYADWLADELERFDEVDLVAHDWGALMSVKVLADRPGPVRSWALDIGDLTDDFRWHDTARIWQTPGDGEAFVEAWLALEPEGRAASLVAAGAPPDAARTMGDAIDPTMCTAILGLYRSAIDIGREWGPCIDRWEAPGLVVAAQDDPFRKPALATALAERTGATLLELPGAGHWWMDQVPEVVAAALTTLWASV